MSKTDDFVRLIDVAISTAEAVSAQAVKAQRSGTADAAANAKAQFELLKQRALNNELLPSNGAGLGITRALDEWAPDDLFAAGLAVESFYRQHY